MERKNSGVYSNPLQQQMELQHPQQQAQQQRKQQERVAGSSVNCNRRILSAHLCTTATTVTASQHATSPTRNVQVFLLPSHQVSSGQVSWHFAKNGECTRTWWLPSSRTARPHLLLSIPRRAATPTTQEEVRFAS